MHSTHLQFLQRLLTPIRHLLQLFQLLETSLPLPLKPAEDVGVDAVVLHEVPLQHDEVVLEGVLAAVELGVAVDKVVEHRLVVRLDVGVEVEAVLVLVGEGELVHLLLEDDDGGDALDEVGEHAEDGGPAVHRAQGLEARLGDGRRVADLLQ